MDRTAIVIGAGIAGLAMARALAARGYKVTVVERNGRAVGASIRNFGMIWPVGQPQGELYERALLSRRIWKQLCDEADIWYEETGSLHLAYAADELDVMEEFAENEATFRHCRVLTPAETIGKSSAVVEKHLQGALWSEDEMIVDPRKAIATIPRWMQEKWRVVFLWGIVITSIQYPRVYAGQEILEADEIYVCSGADFETLYPQLFAAAPITKCKLQMMRLASQPENWRIGPSLCGALSLIHYKGFAVAPSLPALKERYEKEMKDYLKWGIHVMVSQNQQGELTIGDSHEYGLTPDPFGKQFINEMILDYLQRFARFKDMRMIESWNGVYPKMTNGDTDIILTPEQGVTIINGLGGAGMTLSFGLCEQWLNKRNMLKISHIKT